MTDRFAKMMVEQRELQLRMKDGDPYFLEPEARAEFLRWNVLALTDELHEMLNEVGWKPWATSRHVNMPAAMKEMADAWHFFLNILLALAGASEEREWASMTTEEIAQSFFEFYMEKSRINHKRRDGEYDGVTGKCPVCHRDLAESECKPDRCQEREEQA